MQTEKEMTIPNAPTVIGAERSNLSFLLPQIL